MQIKVFHTSDQHGAYVPLAEFAEKNGQPDLWVLTGDFFPNLTRGDAAQEVPYQTGYFHASLPVLKRAFRNTPILVQSGNHDFCNLSDLLYKAMFDVHQVSIEKQTIEIRTRDLQTGDGGSKVALSFCGFPEIPYIKGEWNGEADNATLTALVNKVVGENPDILVNHAPPGGIMAGTYGIDSLTSQLFYREHSIKAVLFGHQHFVSELQEKAGRILVEHGIIFSNAATTVQQLILEL